MTKILALLVIIVALYWANKYHKATEAAKKKKEKDDERFSSVGPHSVDELRAYYKRKIDEIESKSIEEIEKLQTSLDDYKSELEKINNLKKS